MSCRGHSSVGVGYDEAQLELWHSCHLLEMIMLGNYTTMTIQVAAHLSSTRRRWVIIAATMLTLRALLTLCVFLLLNPAVLAVALIYKSMYTVPCPSNTPGAVEIRNRWFKLSPARYRTTIRSEAKIAYIKENFTWERAGAHGFYRMEQLDSTSIFIYILGYSNSKEAAMAKNMRVKDQVHEILERNVPG